MKQRIPSSPWLESLDPQEIANQSEILKEYAKDKVYELSLQPWFDDDAQASFFDLIAKQEALKALHQELDQNYSDVEIHAGPPPQLKPKAEKKLLYKAKLEFHIFLCTENTKYRELRNKLNENAGQVSKVVLNLISAALAGSLGITAGAIVGLCAVLLYLVLKIGKEVYCSLVIEE
jgi:hypothetical protein